MKNYIDSLSHTSLFLGIAKDRIEGLLNCIQARVVKFSKDEFIIEEGSLVYDFGVMLSGRGRAVKWDANGRLIIITLLKEGSEIGVILAAGSEHKSSVWVQVTQDAEVLTISFDSVVNRCGNACPEHEKLLRNYISIVAQKGLVLHERIDCLLKPTVRDKVLNYLTRVAAERQSRTFQIPMNRNEMAEYLNVERSALSRELSNMKRAGLIDYHRNGFKLL